MLKEIHEPFEAVQYIGRSKIEKSQFHICQAVSQSGRVSTTETINKVDTDSEVVGVSRFQQRAWLMVRR